MNNQGKHLFYFLLVIALVLSIGMTAPSVQAAEFEHLLSNTATDAEKAFVEELQSADPDCVYSYTTKDFVLPYSTNFGDTILDDPDAYNGKAAEIRADIRKAKEPGAERHLNLTDRGLSVCTVDVFNKGSEISKIPVSQLIADGKYHLYKLDDCVVTKDTPNRFLMLFTDWGFQVPGITEDLAHKPDAKVDLYLSMKITGDLSFQDEDNLPAYYIDRLIAVGPEKQDLSIIIDSVDETKPVNNNQSADTGSSADLSAVTLIIFGVIIVALIAVAIVVMAKTGNRALSLVLIVLAVVLLVTAMVLYLTGALTSNGTNNNGDSSSATLTEENSLNLNNMQVVLPKNPVAVETNAAKELVAYVNKMTGESIEIVNEGAAVEAGIYVGDTEFAKANNVTHPSSEYGEGWAIKAVDGNLVLCGDATRGTLYAVYHLLEDALGVRWWTYTEEYVPSVDAALVWNEYDDSGAPAFAYRDMHPGVLNGTQNVFQGHNRLNGICSNPPDGYGGEENFGAPAYVHTFAYYVPSDMFAEHPEWFSLVDGKRVNNSQLCLSNEELLEYMTDKLLGYIADDLRVAEQNGTNPPRWYSLTPNDWDLFCGCSACAHRIEKSGLSGYVLQFVNQIAEVVEESYPDVLLDTLAYQQYMLPPKDDTKPAKNVQIRFANLTSDVLHGFDHPNNAKSLDCLKQWAAITEEGRLVLWDYPVNFDIGGVVPTMYKLPKHFQALLEVGVTGYFGEHENPINTDFWDMKMWLSAKLLEDPYQDFDALMNDFLNGYYGAAGPYVRKYLDLVGGLLEQSYAYAELGKPTLNPRWLTLEAVNSADKYFDQAFAAAEGDKTLLRRLRLARNCLDRVIVANYDVYAQEAADTGVSFKFDREDLCRDIIDCLHEQIEYRGDVDYETDKALAYFENILASFN